MALYHSYECDKWIVGKYFTSCCLSSQLLNCFVCFAYCLTFIVELTQKSEPFANQTSLNKHTDDVVFSVATLLLGCMTKLLFCYQC